MAEVRGSVRTWFGTLTLHPARQALALAEARRESARQGVDFDALSEAEQFRRRHKVISAELTRWLKRLRKETGAPLRFCLVAEAHKSGAPHYHCLIHEGHPAFPIRHAALKNSWKWGFSKFVLVHDENAAGYVTKYLSKSALARVRASVRYGNVGPSLEGFPQRGKEESDHQKALAAFDPALENENGA